MVIRQQQMEVLSNYMLQQFEDRMLVHLQANFPKHELTSDEPSLRSMIRKGTALAAVYNIAFEDDIRRYLDYMVTLSPDFDTNPATSWARNILERKNLSGSQKMREIDNVYIFSRMGHI